MSGAVDDPVDLFIRQCSAGFRQFRQGIDRVRTTDLVGLNGFKSDHRLSAIRHDESLALSDLANNRLGVAAELKDGDMLHGIPPQFNFMLKFIANSPVEFN